MKIAKFLLILSPVFALSVSCEQQKWEDTKGFNQNLHKTTHGEAPHAEGAAHVDAPHAE